MQHLLEQQSQAMSPNPNLFVSVSLRGTVVLGSLRPRVPRPNPVEFRLARHVLLYVRRLRDCHRAINLPSLFILPRLLLLLLLLRVLLFFFFIPRFLFLHDLGQNLPEGSLRPRVGFSGQRSQIDIVRHFIARDFELRGSVSHQEFVVPHLFYDLNLRSRLEAGHTGRRCNGDALEKEQCSRRRQIAVMDNIGCWFLGCWFRPPIVIVGACRRERDEGDEDEGFCFHGVGVFELPQNSSVLAKPGGIEKRKVSASE